MISSIVLLQVGAVRDDSGCRERARRAGADVERAEPAAAACGPGVRIHDRARREQIQVEGVHGQSACTATGSADGEQGRVDRGELVADGCSHAVSSRSAGLFGRAFAHASRSICCSTSGLGSDPGCSARHSAISIARFASICVRPARQRAHGVRELGDLAVASSVYPWRASAAIHSGSVRAASSPSALITVCSFIATRESTFDHLPSAPSTFTFSQRWRWMCGSSARERRCCSSTTSMR